MVGRVWYFAYFAHEAAASESCDRSVICRWQSVGCAVESFVHPPGQSGKTYALLPRAHGACQGHNTFRWTPGRSTAAEGSPRGRKVAHEVARSQTSSGRNGRSRRPSPVGHSASTPHPRSPCDGLGNRNGERGSFTRGSILVATAPITRGVPPADGDACLAWAAPATACPGPSGTSRCTTWTSTARRPTCPATRATSRACG